MLTNDTTSIFSEYYTREDLARDLRRSTRTLDRWHVLRIGPTRTKIGKLILYRRRGPNSVAEWLEAQTEEVADARA